MLKPWGRGRNAATRDLRKKKKDTGSFSTSHVSKCLLITGGANANSPCVDLQGGGGGMKRMLMKRKCTHGGILGVYYVEPDKSVGGDKVRIT